ncbi:TetR/AcrR family transcriptional regulator [Glycomyces harbinensis]|uniref:Transcriptional regulator, TetR family n=1 Tax=Glycomyces harbinensis TaxID=58114 RepID=A0A1G6RW82_9ACTN|nr:TetR/AcrR family transcriptional regulator [Glycomyces harbinensis]SDD08654.1 transcriptional regulator, TetR family [Glycomyces harbinensis]
MRQNPERRTALIDAAIEVLAAQGARGLTFRAVDQQAGVPIGTASNYFASRDALLVQAGERVFEKLDPNTAPMPADLPRTRESVDRAMHAMVERITAYPSGYLAVLELRLESTRRPELREVLTGQIRGHFQKDLDLHRKAGLPGDEQAMTLLYLALAGLIVERLTLPDFLGPETVDPLITALVERVVPGD